MPPARRQRLTVKRQEVLAQLQQKIALATELNQKHLAAHRKLQEKHEELSEMQERARQAGKEAAELETLASKATNEVRGLHLALGSVTIGTFITDIVKY